MSTEAYLYMESDLAAYSASYYGNLPSHSGYGLGTFDDDNGTDVQTAALNMSVSTLYRKSKANMGTAPIELIHQSRISAARDLLASGAYTIQEISEKVGYEDVRTLRKHFYRKFGIMPSQYRKNNAEPA